MLNQLVVNIMYKMKNKLLFLNVYPSSLHCSVNFHNEYEPTPIQKMTDINCRLVIIFFGGAPW